MLAGLGPRKAPQPSVQRLPGGEKWAEAGPEAGGGRLVLHLVPGRGDSGSVGEPGILWEVSRLVTLISRFPCG